MDCVGAKWTLKKLNEWVAVMVTKSVGSMTCAYLFLVWSLLPLVFPDFTNVVSYVSQSIIQLVLLSIIMVGQDIGGRKVEKRAQQDHEAIMEELREIKEMHEELKQMHQELLERVK